MDPKVDEYLGKVKMWQQELKLLRGILLDCELTEELKWNVPCYTFQNKNIALLGAFKDYCALSFFKGVLLTDTATILNAPGENSQSVKLAKFSSYKEVWTKQQILKVYIKEAISIEQKGLKVALKENDNLELIQELQAKFKENHKLKVAFESLKPGRQRGYLLHFSAPKQSKTRTSRIEKYIQKILDGKGFLDCTCGKSKKLAICDGSHKPH